MHSLKTTCLRAAFLTEAAIAFAPATVQEENRNEERQAAAPHQSACEGKNATSVCQQKRIRSINKGGSRYWFPLLFRRWENLFGFSLSSSSFDLAFCIESERRDGLGQKSIAF
jgi:hypothetical protein